MKAHQAVSLTSSSRHLGSHCWVPCQAAHTCLVALCPVAPCQTAHTCPVAQRPVAQYPVTPCQAAQCPAALTCCPMPGCPYMPCCPMPCWPMPCWPMPCWPYIPCCLQHRHAHISGTLAVQLGCIVPSWAGCTSLLPAAWSDTGHCNTASELCCIVPHKLPGLQRAWYFEAYSIPAPSGKLGGTKLSGQWQAQRHQPGCHSQELSLYGRPRMPLCATWLLV